MSRFTTIVMSALMAAALAACNDDGGSGGGGGGDGNGVRGTWNGTGNYVHNNVPISQFTLNLGQSGDEVSGTYAIKRDARDLMTGRVSGSVSGDQISLTMNPHGSAEGTYSGDSMSLEWVESGFGGADWTGPRNAFVSLTR